MKVIIFGTGKRATRWVEEHKKKVEVEYFLDNNSEKQKSNFLGKTVYGLNELQENSMKYKIIICSSYWKEIAIQLKNIGLSIGHNYLPDFLAFHNSIMMQNLLELKACNLLNEYLSFIKQKKIVMIHGNCQTEIIQDILINTKSFTKKYFIIEIPRIHDFENVTGEKNISNELLQLIDIFIYQKVSRDNLFGYELSSDYILSKLKKECVSISITNPWFFGYYPQSILHDDKNEKNVCFGMCRYGMFPYKDHFIVNTFERLKDIEKSIDALGNGEGILKENIDENLKKSFEIIENQEKDCDIKILDYIQKEYCNKRLYYTLNHPINAVLQEIAYRICIYLGLKVDNIGNSNRSLEGFDQIIYPFVEKILGLKFHENTYYTCKFIDNKTVNWSEYVRLYIKRCLV